MAPAHICDLLEKNDVVKGGESVHYAKCTYQRYMHVEKKVNVACFPFESIAATNLLFFSLPLQEFKWLQGLSTRDQKPFSIVVTNLSDALDKTMLSAGLSVNHLLVDMQFVVHTIKPVQVAIDFPLRMTRGVLGKIEDENPLAIFIYSARSAKEGRKKEKSLLRSMEKGTPSGINFICFSAYYYSKTGIHHIYSPSGRPLLSVENVPVILPQTPDYKRGVRAEAVTQSHQDIDGYLLSLFSIPGVPLTNLIRDVRAKFNLTLEEDDVYEIIRHATEQATEDIDVLLSNGRIKLSDEWLLIRHVSRHRALTLAIDAQSSLILAYSNDPTGLEAVRKAKVKTKRNPAVIITHGFDDVSKLKQACLRSTVKRLEDVKDVKRTRMARNTFRELDSLVDARKRTWKDAEWILCYAVTVHNITLI
jgi:hypothetical protein